MNKINQSILRKKKTLYETSKLALKKEFKLNKRNKIKLNYDGQPQTIITLVRD